MLFLLREVLYQDDDDSDIIRACLVLQPKLVGLDHERDGALLWILRRRRRFDHACRWNELENTVVQAATSKGIQEKFPGEEQYYASFTDYAEAFDR